jgi:hypothetical protein
MPGFPYPIGVNQHHNCDANPVGMFRGYQAEDGEYICTGSTGTGGALRAPDFSGNNQNVLSVQSHPGIFGSNHEIFAEEVPIQTSHNDGGLIGADHFFNDSGEGNRFVCTKFVVFTLFQTGNHPTNAQLTAKGCPTIARW